MQMSYLEQFAQFFPRTIFLHYGIEHSVLHDYVIYSVGSAFDTPMHLLYIGARQFTILCLYLNSIL